jgi:hypothetical protein
MSNNGIAWPHRPGKQIVLLACGCMAWLVSDELGHAPARKCDHLVFSAAIRCWGLNMLGDLQITLEI